MHKHVNEPMPNPLDIRPDIPNGVIEVVRKALAKSPQLRFQSAGVMSGALHEALRRELGTTKQFGQPPESRPNRSRGLSGPHVRRRAPAAPP